MKNIKVIGLILLIATILLGCASIRDQRHSNKWKGHSLQEMKDRFGNPDYWVVDGKMRPVAVYIDTIKLYSPYPLAYEQTINFYFDMDKQIITKIRVYR